MITYHWSKEPGTFLNKHTGEVVMTTKSSPNGPWFTGTEMDWYQTLFEIIIDVSNQLAAANNRLDHFDVFMSKHVCDIMMMSVLAKPSKSKKKNVVGEVSNRFTVHRDDSLGDMIAIVMGTQKGFVKVHT